jgi:hypothetical protein
MPSKKRGHLTYVEELTDRLITVKENNRFAHFQNPNKATIRRILVDGGLITQGTRADFIVSHPEIVDVIVELKGSDTAHGIEQIRATYFVWSKHELAGRACGALIVRGQGIHPKHQANIQRWKNQMQMRHGVVLMVETRNREYRFEEFLPRIDND